MTDDATRMDEGGFDKEEAVISDGIEEKSRSSPHQQVSQDTPQWVPLAFDRLDELTALVQTYLQEQRESKQRQYKHRETIVFVAAVTLLLLIGISGYMTIQGALSGDAFTFVLGTLFGALVIFLQNMLSENTQE